jgi:hypothetical protein
VYLHDMASNKQQRENEARYAQYATTLQTVSRIENKRGQQVDTDGHSPRRRTG